MRSFPSWLTWAMVFSLHDEGDQDDEDEVMVNVDEV